MYHIIWTTAKRLTWAKCVCYRTAAYLLYAPLIWVKAKQLTLPKSPHSFIWTNLSQYGCTVRYILVTHRPFSVAQCYKLWNNSNVGASIQNDLQHCECNSGRWFCPEWVATVNTTLTSVALSQQSFHHVKYDHCFIWKQASVEWPQCRCDTGLMGLFMQWSLSRYNKCVSGNICSSDSL